MPVKTTQRVYEDTKAICAMHDCRLVVQSFLGKPSGGGRSSKAWTFKCPFHGEKHGASLTVWADGWSCFGRCGCSGDVIEFVKRYQRLSFLDACQWLKGVRETLRPAERLEEAERFEMPPEQWREAAAKLVYEACLALPGFPSVMAYLTGARGLNEATIHAAKLGFLAGDYRYWHQRHGLLYQSGVSIPWSVADAVTAINVRRLLPGSSRAMVRYRQVKGGEKGVFLACQGVIDDRPLVIVESELDALLLKQVSREQFQAASLGGAGGRLPQQWQAWRLHRSVFTVEDNDAAGATFTGYLRGLWPELGVIRVPEGKDVGEYRVVRGHDAIYALVMKGIEDERFAPKPV